MGRNTRRNIYDFSDNNVCCAFSALQVDGVSAHLAWCLCPVLECFLIQILLILFQEMFQQLGNEIIFALFIMNLFLVYDYDYEKSINVQNQNLRWLGLRMVVVAYKANWSLKLLRWLKTCFLLLFFSAFFSFPWRQTEPTDHDFCCFAARFKCWHFCIIFLHCLCH